MASERADSTGTDFQWKDLIQRISGGDESALAVLYDKTSRLVYGLASRILRDPSLAEEVTLDVYLQVWRQSGNYDPHRGNPSAWLLTLARSRAIDRLRSTRNARRQEESLDEAGALPATGAAQDVTTLESERRSLVERAISLLSPEQRQVIGIAYYAGLSHSEIADHLGLPLGTIKTRIRLGMMRLREFLQPLQESS